MTGVVGLSSFFLSQVYAAKLNAPIEVVLDPNIGIEQYVTEFFTDNNAEEMLAIINCESGFKHFDTDGEVLKNHEGSSAIGIAQILSSAHPDPKALEKHNRLYKTGLTPEDFDITTLQGNLGYALLLYQIRGTKDWECAKKV